MAKLVIAAISRLAWSLVGLQVIAVAIVAIALTAFQGTNAGFSALMGGLAWLLPSLFFTWRLTRNMSPRIAKQFIVRFYSAEFTKFILAIGLTLLAFNYLNVSFAAFMLGLVAALMSIWIAPFLLRKI